MHVCMCVCIRVYACMGVHVNLCMCSSQHPNTYTMVFCSQPYHIITLLLRSKHAIHCTRKGNPAPIYHQGAFYLTNQVHPTPLRKDTRTQLLHTCFPYSQIHVYIPTSVPKHTHAHTRPLKGTGEVFTTPRLEPGAKWEKFANIDHSHFPKNQYHVEDPYMSVFGHGCVVAMSFTYACERAIKKHQCAQVDRQERELARYQPRLLVSAC